MTSTRELATMVRDSDVQVSFRFGGQANPTPPKRTRHFVRALSAGLPRSASPPTSGVRTTMVFASWSRLPREQRKVWSLASGAIVVGSAFKVRDAALGRDRPASFRSVDAASAAIRGACTVPEEAFLAFVQGAFDPMRITSRSRAARPATPARPGAVLFLLEGAAGERRRQEAAGARGQPSRGVRVRRMEPSRPPVEARRSSSGST
jgi:hypothetical protein